MTRRIVLVTGGATSVGAATVRLLASRGHEVEFTAFHHSEQALALEAEINRGGEARVKANVVDLFSPAFDPNALVADVIARRDGLTAVVNAAAQVEVGPASAMSRERYLATVWANSGVPAALMQAAWQAHRQGRCRVEAIVNVSSVSERYVGPDSASYHASKAALSMLTRAFAVDLASDRIRVNAVAPGALEVERTATDPEWSREFISRVVPIGRPGSAEDVAKAIAFLLSEDAGYITGTVLYVDGGLSLRLSVAN